MVVPGELKASTGNAVDVERWQAQGRESGIDIVLVRQGDTVLPPGTGLVHAIHSTKGGPEAAQLAGEHLPLVVSVCGSDIYLDYPQPAWRPIIHRLWRRADAILFWHEGTRRDVARLDPALESKSWVIGPAVRLEPTARASRASWGIDEDAPLIVLPASLRAPKDPLYPLESLRRLREEFPGLRFLIAGVVRDQAYEPEVRRVLDDYPWATFVGALPRSEMLGLLEIADVVLNTSPEEGFANSVLEAMVMGKAMLLRDNDGNRAAVAGAAAEPPAAAFFATPEEFTRELRRLLLDPALRQAMGRSARDHAGARFSEHAEREAYRRLYTSVAARLLVTC